MQMYATNVYPRPVPSTHPTLFISPAVLVPQACTGAHNLASGLLEPQQLGMPCPLLLLPPAWCQRVSALSSLQHQYRAHPQVLMPPSGFKLILMLINYEHRAHSQQVLPPSHRIRMTLRHHHASGIIKSTGLTLSKSFLHHTG